MKNQLAIAEELQEIKRNSLHSSVADRLAANPGGPDFLPEFEKVHGFNLHVTNVTQFEELNTRLILDPTFFNDAVSTTVATVQDVSCGHSVLDVCTMFVLC